MSRTKWLHLFSQQKQEKNIYRSYMHTKHYRSGILVLCGKKSAVAERKKEKKGAMLINAKNILC